MPARPPTLLPTQPHAGRPCYRQLPSPSPPSPELLDKFDPKSDGADRDWVSIYDESARLLYLEIDYLNEARNTMRFAEDFKKTPWVITPDVYFDLTTPRVLTMQVSR